MRAKIWLDGFNFFHRWPPTAGRLRASGRDGEIARVLGQALGRLAEALGARRGRVIVFLDGGLRRESRTQNGLRVVYAGPGQKADDALVEKIRGTGRRPDVTAVTSDRELAARLRAHGLTVAPAEEFAAWLTRQRPAAAAPGPERALSPDEVREWLEIFSDEEPNSP